MSKKVHSSLLWIAPGKGWHTLSPSPASAYWSTNMHGALLTILGLCSPAIAQMTFVVLPASQVVPGTPSGPFVYDSARAAPMVIATEVGQGLRAKYWTGASWTSEPAFYPIGFGILAERMQACADRARGTVVILRQSYNGLEQTLEWNGITNTWTATPAAPAGFNPGTSSPSNNGQSWSLSYDPVRQKVLAVLSSNTPSGLVAYAWDGSAWLPLQSSLPAPQVQGSIESCVDEARNSLLVITNFSPSSTAAWELRGNTWHPIAPFPFGLDDSAQPVFDPVKAEVVCGGNGGWSFDGTNWVRAPVTGLPIVKSRTIAVPGGDLLRSANSRLYYPLRSPYAQQNEFGIGCPGPMGLPVLTCDQPALGSQMHFSLTNIPPFGLAWPYLFASFNASSWNGLHLPHELTAVGHPGCYLNISPDFMWTPGMQSGFITFPNQIWLAGLRVYLQGMALNLISTNGTALSSSRGLECVVGVPN